MKHQRNCLIKLKENALLNKGLASSQEKAFYDYGILSESGHYYGNSNQHMQSSSSSQGEKIKISEEKISEARDKMKEQIEKNLNALLHSKKGAELENELSQDSGL